MDPEQTHDPRPPEAREDAQAMLPRWWSLSRLWRRPKAPEEPSILQIRAEWAEYEMIFNDILNRWSAKLAREAKMEKKRLARTFEQSPQLEAKLPATTDVKAHLRAQVAQMRGFPHLRGRNDESQRAHGTVASDANGASGARTG